MIERGNAYEIGLDCFIRRADCAGVHDGESGVCLVCHRRGGGTAGECAGLRLFGSNDGVCVRIGDCACLDASAGSEIHGRVRDAYKRGSGSWTRGQSHGGSGRRKRRGLCGRKNMVGAEFQRLDNPG